jgi:hypothetical protein
MLPGDPWSDGLRAFCGAEQGIALAALRDRGGAGALAHLALSEQAQAAIAALLDGVRRGAVDRVRLEELFLGPVPCGALRMHPSWLDGFLRGEPETVVAAVRRAIERAGTEAGASEAARALLRVSLARLEPLPEIEDGVAVGPTRAEELLGWDEPRLVAAITHLGLLALASLLACAAESVGPARVVGPKPRLGSPFDAKLEEALAGEVARPPKGLRFSTGRRIPPARLLFELGASYATRAFGLRSTAQRVASRIPRELGLCLLAEVASVTESERATAFRELARADAWARGTGPAAAGEP